MHEQIVPGSLTPTVCQKGVRFGNAASTYAIRSKAIHRLHLHPLQASRDMQRAVSDYQCKGSRTAL
jgi:hypothetical protein